MSSSLAEATPRFALLCRRRSRAPRSHCSSAPRKPNAAATRISPAAASAWFIMARRTSNGSCRISATPTSPAPISANTRRGLSRRSRPHHAVLHRPRPCRDAGQEQHRHRALAAWDAASSSCPNYGRQAYNHEGRFKFFGGVVIYANGGGAGLVESEYKAAAKHGVDSRYGARAMALAAQARTASRACAC